MRARFLLLVGLVGPLLAACGGRTADEAPIRDGAAGYAGSNVVAATGAGGKGGGSAAAGNGAAADDGGPAGAGGANIACAPPGSSAKNASCTTCGPASEKVPGCITPALPVDPWDIALAATPEAVALAWVDTAFVVAAKPRVQLSRFAPDLTLDWTTAPFGPIGTDSVAVVPAGDGWIVAAGSLDENIDVYTVDACGAVMLAETFPNGKHPVLAARPEGPLLVWEGAKTDGRLNVVVLSPQGMGLTKPVEYDFEVLFEQGYGSAIFSGDAFIVSSRAWKGIGNELGATLFRVGLDGALSSVVSPVGTSSEAPHVVSVNGELRMTYSYFGKGQPAVRYVRLDPYGAPLTAPVDIATDSEEFQPISLLPDELSGGVIGVFPGNTSGVGMGDHVDVRRLDADGNTTALVHVAKPEFVYAWPVARRGGEVVVAWKDWAECHGIGLARVAP